MSCRTVNYHVKQGMSATITGQTLDLRHVRKVSFWNYVDSATPSGDFTYQFTNDPRAVSDPSNAAWLTITPAVTHGAQPAGSAAGSFAVVWTDTFRYVRQIWTRVAGGASDHVYTWVDLDSEE
jgi:hypothetical protein